MEKLIAEWLAACSAYRAQIELLESGKLKTNAETTPETIEILRACLRNLEDLIAKYKR